MRTHTKHIMECSQMYPCVPINLVCIVYFVLQWIQNKKVYISCVHNLYVGTCGNSAALPYTYVTCFIAHIKYFCQFCLMLSCEVDVAFAILCFFSLLITDLLIMKDHVIF